ncbi:MAG: HAMP domain-containing histidine kinase [Phaeodactylibacter sp.]|nr:HAMP domain-containing histidine kinase [Phaeodactylibacter sp.]MCB9301726.1 HAMP domain-containing histidine kinase [Lewinellaceae bacterium]
MKLLEKNNRLFFRFTALLLLGGSLLFYLAINWIIRHEIDEKLEVNRLRTVELLQEGQPTPQFSPIVEVLVFDENKGTEPAYSDTLIYDPVEKEAEPYRQLISYTAIGGRFYQITTRSSLLETEDLMLAIGGCTLGLALLLFIGLYWLNRRSAQRLWEPFQQQLAALKGFSLAQQEPLELASSGIFEFEELKSALQQLTEKVRTDYRNLKEFTENASHEIQTPLAIIRSKIESLIEQEHLGAEQMSGLETLYEAANRLSRLNKSLLLLAKIENRQFGAATPVSFNDIIREQVEMLHELTEAKGLQLRLELSEAQIVPANRPLLEILVKNLLENAVRYSQPGDTVSITTSLGKITFSNPGKAAVEHPERLFDRFYKQGNHRPGMGLGLAIVKKICEVNGWEAGYSFREGKHEFSIIVEKSSNDIS